MKLSSQVKFIATIFVVLISINQINCYVHNIPESKRLRLTRESGSEPSESTTLPVIVTNAPTGDPAAIDAKPTINTKYHNVKKPEAELEPPEKTWKALQIFGIGMFIIVVAYYINKLRKKFERDNDDDML